MASNEILAEDRARAIGFDFIRSKYYRARVTLDRVRLTAEGALPVYCLEGHLEVPSRGALSKFLSPPAEHTFSVSVHAREGYILHYELR